MHTSSCAEADPHCLASGGSLASAGGAVTFNGSTTTATFVMDADVGVPVLQCQKVGNDGLPRNSFLTASRGLNR